MDCFICLENITKKEKFSFLTCKCSRPYHDECITKWLKFNRKCPLCKDEWNFQPVCELTYYSKYIEPEIFPNTYKCASCDKLYEEEWNNRKFGKYDDIIEINYKGNYMTINLIPICSIDCYNFLIYNEMYSTPTYF